MAEFERIEELQAGLPPDAIQNVETFRDEVTVVVNPEQIVEVCRYCRDTKGLEFNLFSSLTGIDYYPSEPRFGLAYHLYSLVHNHSIRLKVYVSGDEPVAHSVMPVYPAANWFEREIFDLLGVTFTDHPDLRRIMMPDDWNGHPLRKDYPLGYETVQFSFNRDEVTQHKPYAKE